MQPWWKKTLALNHPAVQEHHCSASKFSVRYVFSCSFSIKYENYAVPHLLNIDSNLYTQGVSLHLCNNVVKLSHVSMSSNIKDFICSKL